MDLLKYNLKGGRFSLKEKYILLFFTVVAAMIRIAYQYDREFFGDEIGTIIHMGKSISYLLSHFELWLTMNYFILIEKFIGALFGIHPFTLGFLPLLAGISLIPLTAILSLRFTTSKVSLIAAGLVAFNPCLIMFSGIIRSYSLLAALSIVTLILFFRWFDQRTRKNGFMVALACILLTMMHPYGVYTIIYIVVLIVRDLMFYSDKDQFTNTRKTLLEPLFISAIVIIGAYIGIIPEMLSDGRNWHATPPTSMTYIPELLSGYFSKGYAVWVSILLFFAGIVSAWKNQKPLLLLLPYIFLPILFLSLQGFSHYPWAYGRFLIFCLPIMIVVMSDGIMFCSRGLTSKMRKLFIPVLIGILLATWIPNLVDHFEEKITQSHSALKKAAAFIKNEYRDGDMIICDHWYVGYTIRQYLLSSQYRIQNLFAYTKDKYTMINNNKLFLIGDMYFNTEQPMTILDETDRGYVPFLDIRNVAKIAIYEPKSKVETLKLLKKDLIGSVEKIKIKRDRARYYGSICLMSMFLRSPDANKYCALSETYYVKSRWEKYEKVKSFFD